MDADHFLRALARDGAAFGDACAAAGLAAEVPSCPGWSVADLCWHLGSVHDFWRRIVAERRDSWDGMEPSERPADDELVEWYRTGFAATLDALRAADPAQPNWTWADDDHTAGFVIRRMAQETAVHCWDAQQAAGDARPIEAELASDGIDEFLHHFLGDESEAPPVAGSVHLHCTDVDGEWTIRERDDGFDVTREHAKGDCAIRGAASDLLLVLWRRQPLSTVDVVGDAEAAARFVAYTALN
jgi:uncharacterized protein (TIGR03083 family)